MEPSGANGFSLGGGDPRTGRLDQSSLAPAAPLSEDLGSRGGSAHPLAPRGPWHPLLCLGAQGPHVEHGQAPPVGFAPYGTIPPMGARPMALWGERVERDHLPQQSPYRNGMVSSSRRGRWKLNLTQRLWAKTKGFEYSRMVACKKWALFLISNAPRGFICTVTFSEKQVRNHVKTIPGHTAFDPRSMARFGQA